MLKSGAVLYFCKSLSYHGLDIQFHYFAVVSGLDPAGRFTDNYWQYHTVNFVVFSDHYDKLTNGVT